LDGTSSATDHLILRLAEPFLRSACALLETLALQPPEPLPEDGLLVGGRGAVGVLVANALVATAETAEAGGDVVMETAAALLLDASKVLAGGAGP
jgi:hypothetical protein